MGYNLKRVKMVSKKDYNTRAFGSKFCIDEKGSLYIYSKEDRISRVNLDRTVEDFLLPGIEWTDNENSLCAAPILVEDGIFHFRNENGYYLLKTDMDFMESYRISLEGGYSRRQFWYDNHLYFTISNKKPHPRKTVLVKMDTDGTICWEYSLEEKELSDTDIITLNDGKVIIPVRVNGNIHKLHLVDRNGNLLSEIENLKIETRNRWPEIKLLKDNMGNICIYAKHSAGREYSYVLYVIVLNAEGKELYRNTIDLFLRNPLLFLDGKYIYEKFNNYSNDEVIKVDLTDGTKKTIFTSETMISSMGSCVDGKVYICRRSEKQSWLTCLDKEEKELWQFTTKERILLFEVKGDYLYFTTKNKICIYRIEEE